MRIALVDISHIFRAKWHSSADKPLSFAQEETIQVAKEIGFKSEYEGRVAFCFDIGPYLRAAEFPSYKANREASDPGMTDQYRRMIERLGLCGLTAWGVKGYEADDIIATAVLKIQERIETADVDVWTNDKDLFQLVRGAEKGVSVSIVSTVSGERYDSDATFAKFQVYPESIGDFLALMGDSSDNIPGVKGCGKVTAAKLITQYGSLDEIVEAAMSNQISSKVGGEIARNAAQVYAARKMVQLIDDAPIDISELFEKRERDTDMDTKQEPIETSGEEVGGLPESPLHPEQQHPGDALIGGAINKQRIEQGEEPARAAPQRAIVQHVPQESSAVQLRPGLVLTRASFDMLKDMAKAFDAGGLYSRKFDGAPAIFTVMELGMELGISPQIACQNFHMIEGRPSPASHFLIALAKKDPDCLEFECTSHDGNQATYVCRKRVNPDRELTFTYTMEDAEADGMRWAKSTKNRKAMLRKTAGSQAARLWFPEATCGLYSQAEMGYEEDQDA